MGPAIVKSSLIVTLALFVDFPMVKPDNDALKVQPDIVKPEEKLSLLD